MIVEVVLLYFPMDYTFQMIVKMKKIMIGIPYLGFGIVKENGVGVSSATVKARNETNNELISQTTDANGVYLFDFNDFISGWSNGDKVTIYVIYTNFEGQETITINTSTAFSTEQDIALCSVEDSQLIDYCTVQDVYDELDNKTASDISAERIVKAVRRAEGLIDIKTGTFFKQVTRTDEVHTVTRYSIETSHDNLDGFYTGLASNSRRDSMGGFRDNRVRTDFKPVVSITSLSINKAAFDATDSFTALTEQTGSGGDIASISISGIIDLNADDTVELWATTDIVANRDVIFDDTTLTIIQVGGGQGA